MDGFDPMLVEAMAKSMFPVAKELQDNLGIHIEPGSFVLGVLASILEERGIDALWDLEEFCDEVKAMIDRCREQYADDLAAEL